jgi:hypothetical protein
MTTGIDGILQSPAAQEFWLRRLIAVIIDYAILFFPIYVISAVAFTATIWGFLPWFVTGAIVIAYTALFESELGYTVGKRVMALEVVPLDGRPIDFPRAAVRNVSKVHPVFLLIDVLLGLFMENRPNMRYLDTTTRCEVVDTNVAQQRRAAGLAPPVAGAPPAAPAPHGVVVEADPAPAGPAMPPAPPPPQPPAPPAQPAPLPPPSVEVERPAVGTGDAAAPPRRAPGIPPPTVPMPPTAPPAAEPGVSKGESMADYGTTPSPPPAKKPAGDGWEELAAPEGQPQE